MVVKFESCVQHSTTLIRSVFQIHKQFLVLIILDSTTFDLLQNSFLILIFNISVFYLLFDSSFSHLCHFHFVDTLQRCFSPPSPPCILWFPSSSNTMAFLLNISQQVRLFSLVSGSFPVLLFLPKRITPYTNVYLFFKVQYIGASFLMELGTSPVYYRASCASFHKSPFVITSIICCSGFQCQRPLSGISITWEFAISADYQASRWLDWVRN